MEHTLLITMLTIKILFTINSLKKLFCQNTIYNSFRLKTKHLVLITKKIISLNKNYSN